MKVTRPVRCTAVVLPGEYVISRWDGQQCEETNPRMLILCDGCGKRFCRMHWYMHIDSVPASHFGEPPF